MDNLNSVVFVYSKEGKVKVLDLNTAVQTPDLELKADGWNLTATLDPCKFIEYLSNECNDVDILSEIKELKHGQKAMVYRPHR